MKKILLILLFISFISNAEGAYDKHISFDKLPVSSQRFIKKYFPNHKIALAKKEVEFIGISYDVIFTNGDKIEFSKNGDWTEVKCKTSEVPSGIVPIPIFNYVRQNYPNIKITEIERKTKYIEIELSSKVKLKFNKTF